MQECWNGNLTSIQDHPGVAGRESVGGHRQHPVDRWGDGARSLFRPNRSGHHIGSGLSGLLGGNDHQDGAPDRLPDCGGPVASGTGVVRRPSAESQPGFSLVDG
jgi:hypothetical protein